MAYLIAALHALLLAILASNLVYLRRRRSAGGGASPFISVLIPARNEANNLRRLLPTLLSQSYPAYEVIVYDDASEDATWDVLQAHAGDRLRALRGSGPPEGWIGKVHALFQATRAARGDVFLFLDADVELADHGALERLVRRFAALPADSVLTGYTRLRGGAKLLVSLVPHAMLCQLPWGLVRRMRSPLLGALNGQCWMIDAAAYRRYEPHEALPAEILEDVEIGRYLKRCGMTPVLVDVQREVAVYMYRDFADGWQGFRKNVYLIMGGRLLPFLAAYAFYLLVFVLAPLFSPWLLGSIYLLKGLSDRRSGFPWWVTLLAPVSFALGAVLQLDSAVGHLTRRVTWKGRTVGGA